MKFDDTHHNCKPPRFTPGEVVGNYKVLAISGREPPAESVDYKAWMYKCECLNCHEVITVFQPKLNDAKRNDYKYCDICRRDSSKKKEAKVETEVPSKVKKALFNMWGGMYVN